MLWSLPRSREASRRPAMSVPWGCPVSTRLGLGSFPGAGRSQLEARAAPGLQPAPLPAPAAPPHHASEDNRRPRVPTGAATWGTGSSSGTGPISRANPASTRCLHRTRCCHPPQPPHPLGLPAGTGQPQLPLPFHTLVPAPKLNPGPKPSPAQPHREGEPWGRRSPALRGVTQVGTGTPSTMPQGHPQCPGPRRGCSQQQNGPRTKASSGAWPRGGMETQPPQRHLPGGAARGGGTSNPTFYYASFMGRNFFLCCLVSC